MQYEHPYHSRSRRGSGPAPGRPHRVARRPRPRPGAPGPVPEERGYRGPGELGRYGNAPVPYGPDHTYDYHLGDRYGYGPDYLAGERRVRRPWPAPPRPRRGPRW